MASTKENTVRKPEASQDLDTQRQGLCPLCKIESVCTYPKNRPGPISFCEEFEPYESRTPVRKTLTLVPDLPDPEEREASKYKGLCSNCEIRETCVFPKQEGGVWRCEEYR